jgi:hypothetical protein
MRGPACTGCLWYRPPFLQRGHLLVDRTGGSTVRRVTLRLGQGRAAEGSRLCGDVSPDRQPRRRSTRGRPVRGDRSSGDRLRRSTYRRTCRRSKNGVATPYACLVSSLCHPGCRQIGRSPRASGVEFRRLSDLPEARPTVAHHVPAVPATIDVPSGERQVAAVVFALLRVRGHHA